MSTYSKASGPLLRKRLEELNQQLKEALPELVEEIRLVESRLRAFEAETPQVYKGDKYPSEAVDHCLDLCGDFTMTKKKLIRTLIEGGYLSHKPKAVNGLLNDSINNSLEKGRLVYDGEMIGRSDKLKTGKK